LSTGKQRHWWVRRSALAVVATLVATTATLVAATTPAGASPPPLVFLNEPFTGSQVQIPSNWVLPALPSGVTGTNAACLTASATTTQTPIPGCQNPAIDTSPNGALRLTSATTNLDGGASYAGTVPSSQGLDIRFSTYQYSGTGADGILFYLAGSDPTQPAPPTTLGPPGGHLGYSGGTAFWASAWTSSATTPTAPSTAAVAPTPPGSARGPRSPDR
jgi:large repetitive protein